MKREKGEGHVRTHASGLKEVRAYIPPKLRHKTGGKPSVSFYGRTPKAAMEKRDAFLEDLRSGYSQEARELTVAEYLERWLCGPLKRRVSVRTLEDYRASAEKHLMPPAPDGIGAAPLSEVTAQDLDDLYERKLSSGVGTRSVRYAHQTISAALQNAAKKRLIPYNPARDADAPPAEPPKERATLSWAEAERFFEAARGDRFEHLFTAAVLTGARPGELLALKWADVSLPAGLPKPGGSGKDGAGSMLVRDALATTKKHGLVPSGTTKTRRSRPVSLMPEAVAAFRAQRAKQAAEVLKLKGLRLDEGLVFPNTEGSYMNGNNLSRRHFKPIVRRAGLPEEVRLYDLRHTFATLWVEAGEPLELLSKILGHTTIKLTADTYVHAHQRMQAASLERFGSARRRASAGESARDEW